MRRFIEEFKVKDPDIAYRIAAALETRDASNRGPVYEVDIYPAEGIEHDAQNERMVHRIEVSLIKIFVREELVR